MSEGEPRYDDTTLIKEAVRDYLDSNDIARAIAFLRAHPQNVSEFCLQIRDAYHKNDPITPIIEIAKIIEGLL